MVVQVVVRQVALKLLLQEVLVVQVLMALLMAQGLVIGRPYQLKRSPLSVWRVCDRSCKQP